MAQVLSGSILGDVKDSSGALIPGAAIVVTERLAREALADIGSSNVSFE
jgi:hypothetical protein